MKTNWQPSFFQPSNPKDRTDLEKLKLEKFIEIIDALEEAVEDLFKIDFPYLAPGSPEFLTTYKQYIQEYCQGSPFEEKGVWVYFQWKRCLVHLPQAHDFYKLRTARNQFLIEPSEQDAFYAAKIGVAGLSVGSSVVNSIVLSGGAGTLRLADLDTLAIVNLNRLLGSVCDLGKPKALNTAHRVYELNPFQDLTLFSEGFNEENTAAFFGECNEKLDLFIEEMDNIYLKISSRLKARELKIPVIMATDNGDNAYIDVERFDLEPTRPLFHNLVPEKVLRSVSANPSQAERVKLASKIVGSDITPRTQISLMQVGTKLPSWPQLGNAATLSGAAVSYVARRIITGQPMPSGRYAISFDKDIDPEFNTPAAQESRTDQKERFIQGLELLFGMD